MAGRRTVFLGWAVATAALLVLPPSSSGEAAAQAPARQAAVSARDPLPVGPAPRLPYLDVAQHRIVDGSRSVDVTGLQGTVVRLFKVDGGYVLGRIFPGGSDLAFVSTSGARRLLTGRWDWPNIGNPDPGLVVTAAGDRIVFNTRRADGRYLDTAVMTVLQGRVPHRRTFSEQPRLLAATDSRTLMSVGPAGSTSGRVLWWTPGRTAVTTLAAHAAGEAADLTAGAFVLRSATANGVRGIPAGAPPAWDLAAGDWAFGSWSPDDTHLAGTGEILRGTEDVEVFHVLRASDGAEVHTFHVLGVPEITWEDDDTVLMRAGESQGGYRLLRCTLAGDCEYVEDISTRYGPYVVATRRAS